MFYYNTAAASDYYRSRGLRRSQQYLRKLRHKGRGAEYHLINGVPHYTAEAMDADIAASVSPPARSPAEHRRRRALSREMKPGAIPTQT